MILPLPRIARLFALVVTTQAMLACRNDSSAVSNAKPSDSASLDVSADTLSRVHIQWHFRPNLDERATILQVLARLRSNAELEGEPVVGELYRLAMDSIEQRYVLVTALPDSRLRRSINLIAFGKEIPTPAYKNLEIEDLPERFAVASVRDWDDDGQADLVYCRWTRGDSGGIALAVGVRRGAWYQIPRAPSPADCTE